MVMHVIQQEIALKFKETSSRNTANELRRRRRCISGEAGRRAAARSQPGKYVYTFTATDEGEWRKIRPAYEPPAEYTAGESRQRQQRRQTWLRSEIQQQMSERQIFTAAGDTRKSQERRVNQQRSVKEQAEV